MKTEEINKRIEWINARTPLNDLQKEYVSLIVSESIKDKTKELQEQLAEVTRMRNHLEECVNMRIEQLAAKEKEWISVEDDLKPDFYVKVLMEVSSDDTNYYDIGSYTRDGWHSHLRKLPNVIKWKYIN